MLTISKQLVHEKINKKLKIELFGQELNDVTYAICKSDFLMGDENPENIKGPLSSLSEDGHQDRKFDYMLTNPPFGVSWKSEQDFIKNESKDISGRFSIATPRTSDGSLLFLQHLIHKMEPKGSRIGIIFNGSPLFSGDAGGGESEIRKWIIENDWLECIVQLPSKMFFNTGITTYMWIVTNKKSLNRKGTIQIIDGSSFFEGMKKKLGEKNKILNDSHIEELLELYLNKVKNKFSKIVSNKYFGYTKITVEQPLVKNGKLVKNKKGEITVDKSKRDHERVPLTVNIDEFFNKEVKPHLPNSWIDRNKNTVGYEINFNKIFFKYKPMRSLEEIVEDLNSIDSEILELKDVY